MIYGKEGTVTLKEVQADLKTKELSKSRDLRSADSGACLSVSGGKGADIGNLENSKGSEKSKYI
jgi:hypothetical protein